MTLRTTYVVQMFEIHRKRLVPTVKAQSKSELSAVRSAESIAQSSSALSDRQCGSPCLRRRARYGSACAERSAYARTEVTGRDVFNR
jgi:hypothetical protein